MDCSTLAVGPPGLAACASARVWRLRDSVGPCPLDFRHRQSDDDVVRVEICARVHSVLRATHGNYGLGRVGDHLFRMRRCLDG